MGLTSGERHTLGRIADRMGRSDPRLAARLAIFARLAASEQMPGHERLARPRHPARPWLAPAGLWPADTPARRAAARGPWPAWTSAGRPR
jgi:hypothetical protein